jgi:hypothetical protein
MNLLTIFATSCSVPGAITTFGVGGSKLDQRIVEVAKSELPGR